MSRGPSIADTVSRWQRDFPGFKLRLTRWGALFLFLAIVLAFAAVNSGNNGLMAVLGFALGSYVVSGAWSRQVLAGTKIAVRCPPEVFAGRRTLFEVELVNTSRFFPAYGLVIRAADGAVLLAEPHLGPGERAQRTVADSFARRGWQDSVAWRLEVVLPLGFFLKSKEVRSPGRVLVYPAPSRGAIECRPGTERGAGALRLVGRGREGEVFQLRDFRDGDDRRQVHWKQTARQQRLIMVDRQRRVAAPLVIHLDPEVVGPLDEERRSEFERRVSAVAGAILRRLERGDPVALSLGDQLFGPVELRSRARRLLEPLATVTPRSMTAAPSGRAS